MSNATEDLRAYLLYQVDYVDFDKAGDQVRRVERVRKTAPASIAFEPGDLVSGMRQIEFGGTPTDIAGFLTGLDATLLPDHVVIDSVDWERAEPGAQRALQAAVGKRGLKLEIE